MNILIITKNYHPKAAAAEIQIRRIINGMLEYSDDSLTLITEGSYNRTENNSRLAIINIAQTQIKVPLVERIIDRFFCSLICIRRNNFIREGASAAKRLLNESNFDLLVTISTPFDSHIIGLEIKQHYNSLKWVTLFTDMWPVSLLPIPYKRRKLFSTLEVNLMRTVIANCDGFVTPCSYTIDLIKKHFYIKAQSVWIPHSFDEVNFRSNNQLDGYIVHSGSLQKERIREELVEAVNELARENKEFKGLIQIGAYNPKLTKIIRRYNCSNIVLIGRMPEEIAVKVQSLFKIGIIIEAPMEQANPFIPSKITDSIQLNKKLVVITPRKSFLRDFAQDHKGIHCCNYEKDEIKKCIIETINSSEEVSPAAMTYFHPSNVSKQYIKFFKSLK